MWITKNNGADAFMRRIDAESRVTIWALNHANSPQISKLGLTHVLNGTVDTSGKKVLHANGPGLTLETDTGAEPGLVPSGGTWLPAGQMAPFAPPRNFTKVTANNISWALYDMTAGYDPVYTAKKLGLLKRDMDKATGRKLCREFREPQVPIDGLFNMPCYDADGNFSGRYILFNGTVFEAKLFKYTDSPDGTCFPFAPSESVIYAPPGCNGVFTTNANIACGNLYLYMGWIGKAGGVEHLDWEIIHRFGGNALIVWAEFSDDLLLTKNNFAEAFAIATEAKRRGVAMKIIRATATGQFNCGMYWAQESLLDDREIKKLARKYGLEIDPVWKGLPGEIDFDEELPVRQVPPFWNDNRIAKFFGKESDDFLLEIVTPRLMSWMDCRRVLAVVDEKDRLLARRIRKSSNDTVRVATFDVFKDKDAFLEKIPPAVDMVFIVPPTEEKKSPLPLQTVFELCLEAGLPVGIFSRSENAPLQEPDAVQYCVKKLSSSPEDVFCVKNMGSDVIRKYKFSPFRVEETPGTEENMRKGE